MAIEDGGIKLLITDQIKSEFWRNREFKICDTLKRLNGSVLDNQFPQICQDYQEYQELRNCLRGYEEQKNKILVKLDQEIVNKELGADKIINSLFSKAEEYITNSQQLDLARLRMEIGNPPGKKGSLGDAINWELLLGNIKNGEDLYFVSEDKDYCSPINEDALQDFLHCEWFNKKKSKIFFYRKLSDFFRDKFPNIKLASELEKELAIISLANSAGFRTTHMSIAKLSKYTDFTDQQVNDILLAAINNNQVYWIKDDDDVKGFLNGLINSRRDNIDQEVLEQFEFRYAQDVYL